MAESFFATLQAQLLDRSTWLTRAESRRAALHYVEGFYNPPAIPAWATSAPSRTSPLSHYR